MATVVYRAGPLLRTADVATREVADARDLAAALAAGSAAERDAAIAATERLLAALAAAGARHPDLNLKNVLLAPDGAAGVTALVLDVDRVRFEEAGSARVADANARRLARSLAKWRGRLAPGAADAAVARLAPAAAGARP
jgi:3-deoxy-D-manno-octulosonic acid kinase